MQITARSRGNSRRRRTLRRRSTARRTRRRRWLFRFLERALLERQIPSVLACVHASSMDSTNAHQLHEWIGRARHDEDDICAAPLRGLWAMLDREGPAPGLGADVPPLAHWLYFNPSARQDQLAADGHPTRGDFLPPVELPRRMWAGGSLAFHHPLQVGDESVRDSRLLDLNVKQGRSGPLVFVTVRHAITNARGLAITETQDIVYRDAPRAEAPSAAPTLAPTDEAFSREIMPDPALLFRYSALTFNGHRIHYDRPY